MRICVPLLFVLGIASAASSATSGSASVRDGQFTISYGKPPARVVNVVTAEEYAAERQKENHFMAAWALACPPAAVFCRRGRVHAAVTRTPPAG
jgi:hypothetical protein